VSVDLRGVRLPTDANGLPIHGLLVGSTGWRVDGTSVRGSTARLRASIDVDAPAFPFPHRIDLTVAAHEDRLRVRTDVVPTGRRSVPIAIGWHPYLQLPGTPRRRWRLRLPGRHHLALDDRGIPTGHQEAERAEAEPIGRRTFDDLYALGRGRRLAFEADTGSVELRCGPGYPFAQVWVPAGKTFAALEPMAAPTNALVAGTAPLVAPGAQFSCSFELAFA
jgi:galactose mutarotase-like enzyme